MKKLLLRFLRFPYSSKQTKYRYTTAAGKVWRKQSWSYISCYCCCCSAFIEIEGTSQAYYNNQMNNLYSTRIKAWGKTNKVLGLSTEITFVGKVVKEKKKVPNRIGYEINELLDRYHNNNKNSMKNWLDSTGLLRSRFCHCYYSKKTIHYTVIKFI